MPESTSKVEVKESPIHGLGVFATREIKRGETILSWHPKILTPLQVEQLTETERQKYLYVENGIIYLQQEPERYVNHSCDPNSYVKDQCDIALRDIHPGEEITSNYLNQGAGSAPDKFICNCHSPKCSYRAGIVT